jgi:glycosyltransferase involved in cell wall biosynthesis
MDVRPQSVKGHPELGPPLRISAVICAYNEERALPACLHALLAQTRLPDEIVVVDNGSTDRTAQVASAVPGVRVITEPTKGLVRARETGRLATQGDVLAYVDADCRPPLQWLARLERHFVGNAGVVAVTGPYRFYDWDWPGRLLVWLYDVLVAPATHLLVRALGLGAILYGGNFAVRRTALERIGGFDTSIEFHGEDTNLGRRLAEVGRVVLSYRGYLYTSARRYHALGTWTVFWLYVRNFCSEILRHRPADTRHVDVRH